MPAYPGSNLAKLLYEGSYGFMFQNEPVTTNEASVAFQLRRERGASYPFGASIEISFSGDPGAFEIDIQTADSDVDADYVTINQISTGLNSSFVTRQELPIFWARYIRASAVLVTNSVNVTAMVTR